MNKERDRLRKTGRQMREKINVSQTTRGDVSMQTFTTNKIYRRMLKLKTEYTTEPCLRFIHLLVFLLKLNKMCGTGENEKGMEIYLQIYGTAC